MDLFGTFHHMLTNGMPLYISEENHDAPIN